VAVLCGHLVGAGGRAAETPLSDRLVGITHAQLVRILVAAGPGKRAAIRAHPEGG
jgi:DNA-binding transcriptional regulator LsrR (DeoR family)